MNLNKRLSNYCKLSLISNPVDCAQVKASSSFWWHTSQQVKVPEGIHLMLMPPYSISQLPQSVDREAVNQLCIDLVTMQGR